MIVSSIIVLTARNSPWIGLQETFDHPNNVLNSLMFFNAQCLGKLMSTATPEPKLYMGTIKKTEMAG